MKHDKALPEVVAELTLAETGEMLARDLVEIISQPLTNKTDLVISGLLPGQIYISLRVLPGSVSNGEEIYIIKTWEVYQPS